MYEDEVIKFRDYLTRKRFRDESIKTYTLCLEQLIDVIQKDPRKISKNDVNEWEKYCIKYHTNSLTPKYCAINKYIDYLVDEELLDETTAKKLKLSPPQKKKTLVEALSRNEIQDLFEVAKKRCYRDYAIFITSYSAMLRRSEVLNLKLDDINLEKNQIKILDAKGGKDDIVQISKECSEAIREYLDKYREKPKKGHEQMLFLTNGKRLYRNKLHSIYHEYKLIMGWEKKKFYSHIMRHTGITHYAEKEKDVAILKRQTRHKDIETLIETYVHKTESELKQAYDNAFNNDNPQPIEPKMTPPQQIATTQQQPQQNKQQLKNQLLQRLARGEISQDVYLIAIKQLEDTNSDNLTYYG